MDFHVSSHETEDQWVRFVLKLNVFEVNEARSEVARARKIYQISSGARDAFPKRNFVVNC